MKWFIFLFLHFICSVLGCINIYGEITFHNVLEYWTLLKNDQDLSNSLNYSGQGRSNLTSSKFISDDLPHTKIKSKDSVDDFHFSKGNSLLEESTFVSNSVRPGETVKSVSSVLSDHVSSKPFSGSDQLRDSAHLSSDLNDMTNGNDRSYNFASQNGEYKWNSMRDTSDFAPKPKKYLSGSSDKADLDHSKLHSEFNGSKISSSLIKTRMNSDNIRKANLSPVISRPLEFDRKCAWDIQWASVSKNILI